MRTARQAARFLTIILPLVWATFPLSAQRPASNNSLAHPLPLSHLYWHFLVYQNYLDSKATEAGATSRGSWLRGHLQQEIGFSDADFAFVRASSGRLTAEMKVLDAESARINAFNPSTKSTQSLGAQRDAYIATEVAFLRQSLPPDKILKFEAFLKAFFHQPNATIDGQTGVKP